jgi:uncharacterized protein (UPF0548 family)
MARLVGALRSSEPTYPVAGGPGVEDDGDGFRRHHYEVRLGQGLATYRRAVEGLQGWRAHDVAGISVYPSDGPPRQGDTVIVTLGARFLALAAPCRVVEVIDEPARWGFTYATLPGHPEQGEESFVVGLYPDGSVRFRIDAVSRPGSRLVQLAGAVGGAAQAAGSRAYLRALSRYVDDGS